MNVRRSALLLLLSLAPIYAQTKMVDVLDPAGRPIPGARVTLTQHTSDGGSTSTWGNTEPSGRTEFPVSPGEQYEVTVQAAGFHKLTANWDPSKGPGRFTLQPSTDPADAAAPADPMAFPGFGPQPTADPSQPGGTPAGTPAGDGGFDLVGTLKSVGASLLIAVLPLLAYFGMRELVVHCMTYFMMQHGSKAAAAPPPAAPSPATAPPPTVPEFLELNTLNGILLNGAAQTRVERAQFTARRKLQLVAISLLAQVGGLAAAASLLAWKDSQALTGAAVGMGVLLLLDLFLLYYSFTTYLQRTRVIEVFAALAVVLTIAAAVAGIVAGLPFYLTLIPLITQNVVLIRGWREIRAAAHRDGNRKVVILRVFGSDKNAAFTFGELMEKWRFVGSYLTISDPALVRYRFSIFSTKNVPCSLGTVMSLGAIVVLVDQFAAFIPFPAWWKALSTDARSAIGYTALAVLAAVPVMLYIQRRFLKTPEAAANRVERVRNARLGLESDYGGSALFCFDDVWKPAVAKMLGIADVVMMDLRGFSAERQGCAYEIGELVNRFPIDRLLFLVDSKTPRDLLHGLIRDRWSNMAADSPNRALEAPVIKVYETSDRDHRDIARIAALLSASIDGRVSVVDKQLAAFV